MRNLVDLSNKLILITGASSGIGKETAVMLSGLGAKCVLVARREAELKHCIEELAGEGHRYYLADLSDIEKINSLVTHIVEENGPLDGMVYSAGISGTMTVKMNTPKRIEEVMRTNFFAYYEMVRSIAQKGKHNQPCRIVGISSVAAAYPEKCMSSYAASKAAMDAATKSLAVELHEKEVFLNTVRPANIRTEMYQAFMDETGMDYMNLLKDRQFMGLGEAEDVAGIVAYLLSPAAKFMTGLNIAVDGGYTCH